LKERTLLLAWAGLILSVVGSSVHAGSAAKIAAPFKSLSQRSDGCLVEYEHRPISSTTIEIDGQAHALYTDEATITGHDEGKPQLPVEVLSLGTPFDAAVTVTLIEPEYDLVQNQLIAPIPSYALSADSSMVPSYKKDQAAYSLNAFYPQTQIFVERSFTLRQQHISTIRLFPYQYNAVTKTLRRLLKAKLDVRFIPTGGNSATVAHAASPGSDPYFEHVYKSLIWNYEQSKQWRQTISTPAPPPDSTRDWFQTGRDYYRIWIANDGWYRVTKADIAAAGGDPSQLDVTTAKVYTRGAEIPIVIRPDSTIEFYAMRKYGDSTYYDYYTDTNAYWLTWGGTPGLRYTSVTQPGGTPSSNVQSSLTTRHFEQNSGNPFNGVGNEVFENDDVPGETWYWDYYFPNTQISHNFVLDSIDAAAGSMARVRVWFYGMTFVSPPPPIGYQARVWINDSLVGDKSWPQRTGALFDVAFPIAWLKNGTNTLTVASVDIGVTVSKFGLDWFEIDYPRFLKAADNQLTFNAQPPTGGGVVLFTVSNFSTPQIDVFDMTGKRQITGATITGNTTTGYSIAFKDTLSVAKKYTVLCSSGQFAVLPMVKKQFSDIRVNTQGADYIIVTNKKFRPAAEQLAAHRHSINGVRTAIIEAQEIYDEFNYGVFSAYPIKRFLRYAYQHWPPRAPAYLLMLGGACVDTHRWMVTTPNYNFVPGYGIFPTGDNWFACFGDSLTFLPSLMIGRISVADSMHALRMVSKVMQYENYPLGAWNKNYMAITGGQEASEIVTFGYLSNATISTYLTTPPLGGSTYRAYRTTVGALVDGTRSQEMQNVVNNGVVFINYLGHASGQVWALDFGNPNNLQNTNGQWPFLATVSCNVGSFNRESGRSLGEDFVLGDSRGAIAGWGSSGFGFANLGSTLVNNLLWAVTVDSMRDFGGLTTTARYRLWQGSPSNPRVIDQVRLTPLLGDPLSKLAIPLRPDLALTPSSLTVNKGILSANDSTLNVRVDVNNYGLVAPDSTALRLTDTFNGQTNFILNDKKSPPTFYRDSIFVPWDPSSQVGRHTLVAVADPNNTIPEVNESNNTASLDQYVYANLLAVVKPLNSMAVPPGVQTLVVTGPIGLDSISLQYFFELDTVDTFNSPFRDSVGPIAPGVVSGQWSTRSLANGRVYFWRARTMLAGVVGNWITSAFITSTDLPVSPIVRWRENSPKQFKRDQLAGATASDSGATIAPNFSVQLTARSLGQRNGSQPNYYSSLQANDTRMDGLPWIWGRGFLGLRVDHLTGRYFFKAFDQPTVAAQADTLWDFIRSTPVGNYLAFAAIVDARTNVSESVYIALESLGSTRIRQVQAGQSWALISRKGSSGPLITPLEGLTNDSVVISLVAPGYFTAPNGTITSTGMSIPSSWDSFHWRRGVQPGVTEAHVALLGVRGNGVVDKLRAIPMDTTDVSLAFLTARTAGPAYTTFKSTVYFSTTNTQYSPVLKDWWVDFTPPADLAISARTIGTADVTIEKGNALNLPVTVYNIGFQPADTVLITVSMYDKYNKARPIAFGQVESIPVNGSMTTTIPISTTNFSRRVTLQVAVAPTASKKDLVADNNVAYYTFNVVGSQSAAVRFFADGVQLMDGDYISPKPKVVVQLVDRDKSAGGNQTVHFFVDKALVSNQSNVANGDSYQGTSVNDLPFAPELSNGRHELVAKVIRIGELGEIDSLEQTVMVNVLGESRIMQLLNYPNPFARETEFTFMLTGTRPPEELTVRVFTIAGRKIREIVIPQSQLQIGFNRVAWDGHDNDGEEIANGYYLYQVSVKTNGKTVSEIGKLVKVR
jgi:hypothetical protein